jgi:hypothetical protein
MGKPNTQSAVTFTQEALRAVIAQAIAEHDAAKAQQAKADTSADMDKACIKAFVRAGYKAETSRHERTSRLITFGFRMVSE